MPWGRVGSNLVLDIFSQSGQFLIQNEPTTAIASRGQNVGEQQRRWYYGLCSVGEPMLVNLSIRSLCDPDFFLKRFQQSESTFVFLGRKNVVRTALSVMKAERYAKWHRETFGSASWSVKPGRELH